MGAIVGLAVSTKYNAGLLLVAYCAYVVLVSRSKRALLLVPLAAASAFAVFVLVNPIMLKGGPSWWLKVVDETLKHRMNVIAMHRDMYPHTTFWQRAAFFMPYWYALPLLAVLVAAARRERWFVPVAIWAAFLIAGTVLTADQPWPRYRAVSDIGAVVLFSMSAISVACRMASGEITIPSLLRLRAAGGPACPRA